MIPARGQPVPPVTLPPTPPQPPWTNCRCLGVPSEKHQMFHVEHGADPRQLERLGLCLAMVAHEVRNLLTPVRLRCEVAAHNGEADQAKVALALAADRSAAVSEAMEAIVSAMTGTAQGDSFDVLDEVGRAVALLESSSTMVDVNVPRGTRASGSGVAFRLAVHNLVRNAVECSPGGRVSVRADSGTAGGTVVLAVTDNGRGLPPSAAHDPFRAFQASSKGGSGLGLSIAAMLLRSCGGDIALARTGPNGTSWTITLRREMPTNATRAA